MKGVAHDCKDALNGSQFNPKKTLGFKSVEVSELTAVNTLADYMPRANLMNFKKFSIVKKEIYVYEENPDGQQV